MHALLLLLAAIGAAIATNAPKSMETVDVARFQDLLMRYQPFATIFKRHQELLATPATKKALEKAKKSKHPQVKVAESLRQQLGVTDVSAKSLRGPTVADYDDYYTYYGFNYTSGFLVLDAYLNNGCSGVPYVENGFVFGYCISFPQHNMSYRILLNDSTHCGAAVALSFYEAGCEHFVNHDNMLILDSCQTDASDPDSGSIYAYCAPPNDYTVPISTTGQLQKGYQGDVNCTSEIDVVEFQLLPSANCYSNGNWSDPWSVQYECDGSDSVTTVAYRGNMNCTFTGNNRFSFVSPPSCEVEDLNDPFYYSDDSVSSSNNKELESIEYYYSIGAFKGAVATSCGYPETPITIQPTEMPTLPPNAVSQIPTADPTAAPSVVPTEVPSEEPTHVPTLMPSMQPNAVSQLPTFTPSAPPSTTPTHAPSAGPSAAPTHAPSASPTYISSSSPSAVPTYAPSAAPSTAPSEVPTAVPTAAPSKTPPSTNLFVEQVINGLNATLFYTSPSYTEALEAAIAACMSGVSADNIYNLLVVSYTDSTNVAAATRDLISKNPGKLVIVLSGSLNSKVTYNIIVPNTNINTTATTMTQQLESSLQSGAFNNYLNVYAADYGAPGLAGCTSSSASVTVVTASSSSSKSGLSAGAIAGIVIAVLVVVGAFVGAVYYFTMYSTSIDDNASVSSQVKSSNAGSFTENPVVQSKTLSDKKFHNNVDDL